MTVGISFRGTGNINSYKSTRFVRGGIVARATKLVRTLWVRIPDNFRNMTINHGGERRQGRGTQQEERARETGLTGKNSSVLAYVEALVETWYPCGQLYILPYWSCPPPYRANSCRNMGT